MARKLSRYLNWLGVKTKVFNVGVYRRQRIGAHQPVEFFDPGTKKLALLAVLLVCGVVSSTQ